MEPTTYKTVCFDLDGTLCNNTFGDYESAQPFGWAIERVNRLSREGHRVLIMTARGSATGIDWEPVTRDQLDRWGVLYDELHFGKPSADVYIDDRAFHTSSWRQADLSGIPGFASVVRSGEHELPGAAPVHLTSIVEVGRTFAGRPALLQLHAERSRSLAVAAGIAGPPILSAIEESVLRSLAAADTEEEELLFAISISQAAHAAFTDVAEVHGGAVLHVASRPLRHVLDALRALTVASQAGPGIVAEVLPAGQLQTGASWRLEVDENGHVIDTLGGDLAIVTASRLTIGSSPGPRTVAAESMLELTQPLDIDAEARPIGLDELRASEEALLIGMPFGILPIATLDGAGVGDGSWPTAHALLRAWGDKLGTDLAGQVAALHGGEEASISKQGAGAR